jgi:hypothetical protein
MTFSHRIICGPAPKGSIIYGVCDNPFSGECVLYENNNATLYRVKRGEKRAFRAWVAANSSPDLKLEGAWPFYTLR